LPAGEEIPVTDKYIFSSKESGKDYYVFSKAFYFPYKVSDLIFLTSRKHCFVGAPDFVEGDLGGLGVENIEIGNCSDDSVIVCFDSSCDISVHGDEVSGYVIKNNGRYDYVGNLLYGAIFSDKDVYDCNVKRLLYRTGKVAKVYAEAGRLRESKGVGTNLISYLTFFSGQVLNATSDDLSSLQPLSEELDSVNSKEVAGLW